MHLSLPCFGFALLNAITTVAIAPAPLLGPAYPPPTDLTTTSSVVPKAWAEVANTLTSWTASKDPVEGQVPDFGSYTFSVGAFSMYDPGATEMLQYHHTAPDVKNSTTGATEADGDSVYRIESVSKVFTVYLTLIKIGSVYWDRSITEFIPYLADFAKKTTPDPLNVVDWTDVTLGALAGHLAGVPRDISIASDDVLLSQGLDVSAEGLPPLNVSDPSSIDPCFRYDNATNTSCMGTPYLEAVTKRPPIFLPWSTPIYSNLAYNLLSLALTNITNQTFAAALQKDMLDPLSLTSTGLSGTKNLSHVIIPGGLSDASIDTTDYASGELYSSVNDLAKFGIAILNSTLLPAEETRKWLKPITHTSSLDLSVGRPWEIYRITQPVTGRTNDLYAKDGAGTGYSSFLILSPDHGAGFSILISGVQDPSKACSAVADALTSIVLPAFEAQAATEASQHFAGTYISRTPGLNSSIELVVNASYGPGLVLNSWVSNGTDMFSWLIAAGITDELSLFPTDLRSAPADKVGQWAFRATYGNSSLMSTEGLGPFMKQTVGAEIFQAVDSYFYGGVSLDLFVVDVDGNGSATS
ncbi:MAG: hypothetical protein OHK93_000001, partial [Ramalina farinacea]|nr:hypothetical protein [Ramalina farinacea]